MGTGALLDYFPLPSLLWVSVAMLLGILLYALLVPEAPAHLHQEVHPPVGEILRQPRVRALFTSCFVMSAAHGALYVFYSIYLADHGYSKSLVGGLWSLGVLAEIAVFFYMSRLMCRIGLRSILLASFAAAVLRFLMIGWGVESLAIIVLAQLLHGLTFGAYHAASITAVNSWFPGRSQARGQALYSSLSFGAGGLLGSLLSGWMWESAGAAFTFTCSAAFALLGLLLVAVWVKEADTDTGAGAVGQGG
jgi:PPP family 3-phenylpropionic acid transporter